MSDRPTSGQTPTRRSESSPAPVIAGGQPASPKCLRVALREGLRPSDSPSLRRSCAVATTHERRSCPAERKHLPIGASALVQNVRDLRHRVGGMSHWSGLGATRELLLVQWGRSGRGLVHRANQASGQLSLVDEASVVRRLNRRSKPGDGSLLEPPPATFNNGVGGTYGYVPSSSSRYKCHCESTF